MIHLDEVSGVLREPVRGSQGEELGLIDSLYVDSAAGTPTFICVQAGGSSSERHLVPLVDATVGSAGVIVPYTETVVLTSPLVHQDLDPELEPDEQERLYRHYGLVGGLVEAGETSGSPTRDRTGERSSDLHGTSETGPRGGSEAVARPQERLGGLTNRVDVKARLDRYIVDPSPSAAGLLVPVAAGSQPLTGLTGGPTTASAGAGVSEEVRRGQPAGDAAAPGDPAQGTVVQRWPHIELDRDEPLPVTSAVVATVFVDTTAPTDEDEDSAPLALPDITEVRLRVLLVSSSNLQVDGDPQGWITIKSDTERSTEARFVLRVLAPANGSGVITALLTYEGRPVGSVCRRVDLGAAAGTPEREELPAAVMRLNLGVRRPDLTVQVAKIYDSGRERFQCTVSTPHLPGYEAGITAPWNLPDANTTKDLVLGRMVGFTLAGVTSQARKAALVGAGLDLFKAAPDNFKDVYWTLRDQGLPHASLLVVSSEPFVPWELMIPSRDGIEDSVPLGVSSAVGRWVDPKQVSPPQTLKLDSSYVIAPTYDDSRRLGFAAEEANYVCEAFSGRRISPALFAVIEAVLAKGGASLLHVICHGNDEGGPEQVIDLDPDEKLTDGMLLGMGSTKAALRAARPMVFLNACQVGRQRPALVGTGGFAARFIDCGASAVVAPIWSVKDSVAAHVARLFYEQVKSSPGKPFAAILSDLRRKAYVGPDSEDSLAAYCFYGDPLAATSA